MLNLAAYSLLYKHGSSVDTYKMLRNMWHIFYDFQADRGLKVQRYNCDERSVKKLIWPYIRNSYNKPGQVYPLVS